MSRIARNSVNGRLKRNTCSGAEVAPAQCKRDLMDCAYLVSVYFDTYILSCNYLYNVSVYIRGRRTLAAFKNTLEQIHIK